MIKKSTVLLIALIFGASFFISACGIPIVKPTTANFKDPVITLELIEVPQFDGYWYYGGKIKPTKGKAGNHGAPLPLAVTFKITNPNPYPVFLDGYRFTIGFEEFDLVTVVGYDTQWIPAGKVEGYFSPKVVGPYSNELRASTMITTRSALLSLLVTGGFKLKAKGTNPWAAMEKWWTTIGDMAFPINIHEGAFTFKANGVTKTLPFKVTYPKK